MSGRKRVAGAPKVRPGSPDLGLLFLAAALLAFGLIMVLSSAAVQGLNSKQNSYYYVQQQLKWAVLGIVAAGVAVIVPYKVWRKFAGVGIVIGVVMLAAVMFSDAGVTARGSARWLRIAGINVQPSEIVKMSLVLFYAHMLDRYPVRSLKGLLVPGGVFALILPLVYKQPDLGTAMVLIMTTIAMLWQTELPTKWFAIGIPSGAAILAYLVRHTPYQWQRIQVWLDPWAYASNLGYQITNAEIAFGSGGLLGVGLGLSSQKFGFLPENYTDMIFAIVGEELGLAGAAALLILFLLFYIRAFEVARQCDDRFGRLLGFGITATLAVQTAINVAVVTGVFPVTGVTLPLISYGGSSLSVTLAEIGMLLNISRYRREEIRVMTGGKASAAHFD